MRQISQNKEYDMGVKGFNAVLEQFPPSINPVKPLCGKLRIILFPLITDGALDLTTPADSEIVYESIIKAFEAAIGGLDKI